MPTYKVTDPSSGQTLSLTGDSPPTEAELNQVFSQMSGSNPPSPPTASGAGEAILTNKPTQGFVQGLERSSPALMSGAAGAASGAATGAEVGTALFPGVGTAVGAILGGLGGAYIGGVAGESARNAAANTIATAMPQKNYPVLNSSQLLAKLNKAGQDQAWNEAFGLAAGGVIKQGAKAAASLAESRLPAGISKYVGIPEATTKYVQRRGAGNVFNPSNIEEGAGMANVGKASQDLSESRSSVGQAIGDAEDAKLEEVGKRPAGVSGIVDKLDKELFKRGITDPKTAPLAKGIGKESSLLQNLSDVLKPTPDKIIESPLVSSTGGKITKTVPGAKITVSQALKAKRLIDEAMEVDSDKFSKPTKALLNSITHDIRVAVRADLGPGISKLWDDFGVIADAQEKLSEFTGQQVKSNVQQRAVQALHQIILKNPKEVSNIVEVIGAGLPGGESQARQIFDSVAATPFTKGGIGAPSNIILKGAAALGLTGGSAAKNALKASESLSEFASTPSSQPKYSYAALEALRRMRQDSGGEQ